MPSLPETKLFSVDMGRDAFCDCGRKAEVQFVITTTNKEAKRLAAEVKKVRKVGGKASDVVCGLCVANVISARGLFVSEVLRHSSIKFERVTDDTVCLDCGKSLPYGTWAHFHADSGRAICIECGVKRGWSDKSIASLSVKSLELRKELAALRRRIRVESDGLGLIEEKVALCQIGEGYKELEVQITATMAKLESYFGAVATPEERVVLQGLERSIHELQDLALSIKQEIDTRLFWLDKSDKKNRVAKAALEVEDEEVEQMRQAPGAGSEVPAR